MCCVDYPVGYWSVFETLGQLFPKFFPVNHPEVVAHLGFYLLNYALDLCGNRVVVDFGRLIVWFCVAFGDLVADAARDENLVDSCEVSGAKCA